MLQKAKHSRKPLFNKVISVCKLCLLCKHFLLNWNMLNVHFS